MFVDRRADQVGDCLQLWDGIAHGDAGAAVLDHFHVIDSVSERIAVFSGQAEMLKHFPDAGCLGDGGRIDLKGVVGSVGIKCRQITKMVPDMGFYTFSVFFRYIYFYFQCSFQYFMFVKIADE